MARMRPKPHYYEDRPLDELLGEIEEMIAACRPLARDMDSGKIIVKHSITIRKQLARMTHMIHSLRKEVIERREKWRALQGRGGQSATALRRGNDE